MSGGLPEGMDPQQLALMAQQREQMAEARANALMVQSASAVYGAMIAIAESQMPEGQPMLSHEDCKRIAHKAKEYGPFLAEAFGLIKLTKKEEPEGCKLHLVGNDDS
jgi:hypothetical protein